MIFYVSQRDLNYIELIKNYSISKLLFPSQYECKHSRFMHALVFPFLIAIEILLQKEFQVRYRIPEWNSRRMREIADNFLNSQKGLSNLCSRHEFDLQRGCGWWWGRLQQLMDGTVAKRHCIDVYARVISAMVKSLIVSTRMVANMMFAGFEWKSMRAHRTVKWYHLKKRGFHKES